MVPVLTHPFAGAHGGTSRCHSHVKYRGASQQYGTVRETMNCCTLELLPVGSINPKDAQLGLLSSTAWTNLFYGVIKLEPPFGVLECIGMSPALPVYTRSACTADLWRPLEKQQLNRCHFGWPQKLGKQPYKLEILQSLTARSTNPVSVSCEEWTGHTRRHLLSHEQWVARVP